MPTTASATPFFPGPCSRRFGCSTFGPTCCTSTTGRRAWCRSICARSIASRPGTNCGSRYDQLRTLCTIHNLAYQGVFRGRGHAASSACPGGCSTTKPWSFTDALNFLKAGIVFADLLNTVSPMYAREIQTPYFGCGLHGVLLQRTRDLCGIVNGVDYEQWNPADDRFLARPLRCRQRDARASRFARPSCRRACGLDVEPQNAAAGHGLAAGGAEGRGHGAGSGPGLVAAGRAACDPRRRRPGLSAHAAEFAG